MLQMVQLVVWVGSHLPMLLVMLSWITTPTSLLLSFSCLMIQKRVVIRKPGHLICLPRLLDPLKYSMQIPNSSLGGLFMSRYCEIVFFVFCNCSFHSGWLLLKITFGFESIGDSPYFLNSFLLQLPPTSEVLWGAGVWTQGILLPGLLPIPISLNFLRFNLSKESSRLIRDFFFFLKTRLAFSPWVCIEFWRLNNLKDWQCLPNKYIFVGLGVGTM